MTRKLSTVRTKMMRMAARANRPTLISGRRKTEKKKKNKSKKEKKVKKKTPKDHAAVFDNETGIQIS